MTDSPQKPTSAREIPTLKQQAILLDGGMGQELLARSALAATPMWSSQVMLDQPELVTELHQDFINAGATTITLNNYAATRQRLTRDGAPELFEPLHAMAIEAADQARAACSAPVALAGCLPPLVASYLPTLSPHSREAQDSYAELVKLQAASVDLFICETMSSIREATAAAEAACASNLPVWVGLSVKDNDGLRLRSEESLADALIALKPFPIQAVLINCSSPEAIDTAMPLLIDNDVMAGGYANGFTSVEPLSAGGTVASLSARKDLGPEQYAEHVMRWVHQGAGVVGGCCEVGPAHIDRIRQELTMAGIDIVTVNAD